MRPLLLISACLLLACSPAPPPSKPHIGLILKSMGSEPFASIALNARIHHTTNAEHYDLTIGGIDNATDLANQVQQIDQLTSLGVDALIVAPADPNALIPALKRAAAKGIAVFHIDTPLAPSDLTSAFIGPDNRTAAAQIGLTIAKKLQKGDPVAIIQGVPSDFVSQERRAGLQTALRDSQMQIVALVNANNNQEQAHSTTHALLTQQPEVKAIFCTNDTMALGAAAAVQASRKSNTILITGFDHIPSIRPLIASGHIAATADRHIDRSAVTAINSALKTLKAKSAPISESTPVDLITH